MKKNELIEFLQRQIEYLQGRLDEALASVNSLTLANEKLTATVDELRKQIASLEDVIKGKGADRRNTPTTEPREIPIPNARSRLLWWSRTALTSIPRWQRLSANVMWCAT